MRSTEKIIHYAYVAALIVYFLYNFFKNSGDFCGSKINQIVVLFLIGVGLILGKNLLTKGFQSNSWTYLGLSFLIFFAVLSLIFSLIYSYCGIL